MAFDKAWSFSALTNYENCPKKYYHLSVLKNVKEPPSEHLTHGHHVHSSFERRLRDKQPLPLGMRQYEPLMNTLANLPGDLHVEQKLAITADFAPCEWFAKNAWARCMVDFLNIQGTKALIVDWKTGKRKDDDDQLSLMAATIFCQLAEIDEVHASYFWMQEPEGSRFDTIVLKRTDTPGIFSQFMPRVKRYQHAHRTTEFPARPGGLCRNYCPVKSCPHHGG